MHDKDISLETRCFHVTGKLIVWKSSYLDVCSHTCNQNQPIARSKVWQIKKETHIRVLMLLYIAHHSWSCRHWLVTNYMMMKFLQVVSLLVLDVSMGKFNKKERKRYDTEINLL